MLCWDVRAGGLQETWFNPITPKPTNLLTHKLTKTFLKGAIMFVYK
jgi:hypothetical protein